ncbi:MAG: M23 family metallopeptidase [Treponema sp.]|nr:M23 family metallopeptidase [Candidatus Treponema equi]
MKKTIFFLSSALMALSSGAWAFDWPVAETTSDSISSDFGQLRGGIISTSVIYKTDAEVHSADAGSVIAVIDDHSDDYGWFESALGTAVIISHSDGLSSVYGNLNADSMEENLGDKEKVTATTKIATSGNTAWQEEANGLEFKVFDKKNIAAVNPKILMPRVAKEPHLEAGTISLCDKNGIFHNIGSEKRLASGTYLVYKTRQPVSPYKTIVAVNGATEETIVFDTIKESNGQLCANGNSSYPTSTVYPNKERQLLAKIQLAKGQSTITVTLMNIQENTTMLNYKLDIY